MGLDPYDIYFVAKYGAVVARDSLLPLCHMYPWAVQDEGWEPAHRGYHGGLPPLDARVVCGNPGVGSP